VSRRGAIAAVFPNATTLPMSVKRRTATARERVPVGDTLYRPLHVETPRMRWRGTRSLAVAVR